MLKKYLPLTANLISQTLLGFAYLFIRMGMAVIDQDAVKFLAFRFVIAFVLLTLMLLIPGGPRIRRPGRAMILLVACGLFNPLISQVAKTASTTYVATSLISLFNSMIPVVMIGFSVLLNREYPTRRQTLFVVISVCGMLMASIAEWTGDLLTPWGLFLVLTYVITISLSRVLVRRATGSFSSYEITYFQTMLGAIGFAGLSLGRHTLSGAPLAQFFAGLARPDFAIALIYTSAGTCVIAFLLMNYASAHLPFAVYSSTCTWSTVVGILSGVFLLHESFTALQIAGTVVIFIGILGINFSYDKGDHRFGKQQAAPSRKRQR